MPDALKPRVYAVATTHLDTSWSWDFETTLRDYLPKTLTENFALFEKYPDYVFSFEGSYRYELLEEYYPELFEKLKGYVARGRWQVSGSSYENGDVNIPSPEALFRNILVGTAYFREKFGKRSEDIYLPDCFGFGWAVPSVAAHANLKGFTTQKLIWSSAYEVPFDLGIWRGPDGGEIYASLDAGDYNRSLKTVRKKGSVKRKLKSNSRKYDLPFTFVLHGIGDRGGAPREESVKAVLSEAARNASAKIEVIPAATDHVFRDMDSLLTREQKAKLPVWQNELVMTDHGVGCYTSRAIGKRWNRRAELLADAAERAAAAAGVLAGYAYPQSVLDTAWKRVIAHQFHDDITGTSLEICCKRNWNDYILSLNQFAEEYRFAAASVASEMDTSFAKGVALVVNNPVQAQGKRAGVVTAEVCFDKPCDFIGVYNANGEEVLAQTVKKGTKSHLIAFCARVPSIGYAAYDVRPSAVPSAVKSDLTVTERTLENAKYLVTLDENGDIAQIFDKTLSKELLSKPIRMALYDYDGAGTYPAWELAYKEVMAPPREYAANTAFSIIENGPARIAIQTVRHAGGSVFKQVISLDSKGETVHVFNEIDWRSLRTLLKTEFPFTVANKKAAYDLGLGVIERGNSKPSLYEVPAQNWADITDTDGRFGVSVFSDSKVGWDKPNNNTLRLTGIHSPRAAYRDAQHLLEFGLNRYSFAVYSHAGSWQNGTQQAAMEFVQPMNAFAVPTSPGRLGAEFSFCSVSDNAVMIRAIKKAQASEEIVLRVNEGGNKSHENVRLQIGDGIITAREVWATEEPKGAAKVENGELVFDIGAFEPKTFALTIKNGAEKAVGVKAVSIDLPYNLNAVTANANRTAGALPNGLSLPAEQFPAEIRCGGVGFNTGSTAPGEMNALACNAQHLPLPTGSSRLHIIAAAFNGDRETVFGFDDTSLPVTIQSADERPGAWDLLNLNEAGYIKKDTLAWNTTHAHSSHGDEYGRQIYFFKYTFDIPAGVKEYVLPADEKIILLAATATQNEPQAVCATELYDSLEKREISFALTPAQSFAVKNNKRGHARSRRKFLLTYAKHRIRREIAQLRKAD